jgi:quinol monooxygenase YgiN
MGKYGYHGQLKAKNGHAEKLAGILLQASTLVRSANGCSLYIVSKDHNDKNVIWVTEVWDTKVDHDNSLKLDSVKALIMQAMPLLDGQPQKGQELEVLGGLGID